MLPGFVERELDGVDAARLTAADPDRREILRDHDGVRADVLAHAPREDEVAPCLFRRRAARDLHSFAVVDVPVAILHEQPAEYPLDVALAARKAAALAVVEDADRLLAAECVERTGVVVRGEQHVDEAVRERLAQVRRHRTVDGAHHSERGHGIRRERALVRFLDRPGDGDAAGVRMLHDDAAGQRELTQDHPRGGQVEQVDQ